jgi:hypothetical protein
MVAAWLGRENVTKPPIALVWDALAIEQHKASPGERGETAIDRPVLLMLSLGTEKSGKTIAALTNFG